MSAIVFLTISVLPSLQIVAEECGQHFRADKDHHDPRKKDNLLDFISDDLRKKIKSMDARELKSCIEKYVGKTEEKLEERDFSRLISARLTYMELKALRDFVEHKPRGYGMDIDKYVGKEEHPEEENE